MDKRITNLRPPLEISRIPRSIENHLTYWKAAEFRTFLLFYGIPVLGGILPSVYLQHFSLLAHAVFILLKNSISLQDLDNAEAMLIQFCKQFAQLYGEHYELANVHQLLHLVDCVRELGPLWATSCFPFEDKNRFVLGMIHGTQKVEMQITAAINMVQKIPELVMKIFPSSVEAKVLLDSLMNAREIKIREQLLEDVYVLGKTSYDTIMDLEMKSALASYLGYMPTSYHVQVYKRLMTNSQIYHSLLYTRVTKRNSFSVQ